LAFEVLVAEGEALGEVKKAAVGETGEGTIASEEPGRYSYQCILTQRGPGETHDALGMVGNFEVAPA
jgi:plastocyanin